MRYFLNRIFKNFPLVNKFWLEYLERIDFEYYKRHCENYKIVPFGNNCIPRVITTINRLKPNKKYGEESFPFDLCFSKFSSNTKLLSTNFSSFFEDLIFDKSKHLWINEKTNMVFNHDHLTLSEFKKRYRSRIENLYRIINNKNIHIFFIVATHEIISNEEVKIFINLINKYREDTTYDLIIINQSKEFKKYKYHNTYCINLQNDKSFKYINRKGDWVGELKKMKNIQSRIFNYKINSKLSKFIKQKCKVGRLW